MVHLRSRSRTPPHSHRKRNDSSRDHVGSGRRSSRKHGSSRSRRYYRSASSSDSSSTHSNPKPFGRPTNPPASKCLGVFGLSTYTEETDLMDVFSKYGLIEKAVIVYDAKTKLSRGFGFVYYKEQQSASEAKENLNGIVLHQRTIRVDYSVTKGPHAPTPGVYMGERQNGKRSRSSYSYRGRSYDDDYEYRRSRYSTPRSTRRYRSSGHRHYRREGRAYSHSSVDSRRSYR